MAIQSARLETTLRSYDLHMKRRSQFRSSIASDTSAPAAPKSFDATHVRPPSVKSRGTVSGTSSYFLKSAHVEFSMGGTRMSGCFSRRTAATIRTVLVHWLYGRRHPMDSLPKLTRQHYVVIILGHGSVLLISAGGGPALLGGPFRLNIPHQTRVQTPLPEVHAPRDPGPDISEPADTQRLLKNSVGKDKGSLRVTTPIDNPPPFRGQYSRKTATYCTGGSGLPAF